MERRKNAQLKIQAEKINRFLVPKFSTKGQLKIQEMAFMLVAVVFFFILFVWKKEGLLLNKNYEFYI